MTDEGTAELLTAEHGVSHYTEADGYAWVKGCQRCEDVADSFYEMASDLG